MSLGDKRIHSWFHYVETKLQEEMKMSLCVFPWTRKHELVKTLTYLHLMKYHGTILQEDSISHASWGFCPILQVSKHKQHIMMLSKICMEFLVINSVEFLNVAMTCDSVYNSIAP